MDRERLLRVGDVIALTGMSRAAIYVEMHEGTLPRPVQVGRRGRRWLESELVAWMRSLEKATPDVGEGSGKSAA